MSFIIVMVLVVAALPYLVLLTSAIPAPDTLARYGPSWDNRDVRGSAERLTGWRRRAHAAHLNGLEAFPPFAAALIFCQLAGADADLVRPLALGFVGFRLMFSAAYIANRHILRSTAWFGGIASALGLFGAALAAVG